MVGELRSRSKEAIEEDIERLKDWLYKQPHLPHDVEPELLKAFVCGTKSLEIAKKKLDAFYAYRNRALDLYDFRNRDFTSERVRELSKATEQFFLPKAVPDGCRVYVIRICLDHLHLFEHQNLAIKIMMMVELALLRWPDVPGYYVLYDLKDLPASIATKISPSVLANSLDCIQDGYPIKLKGIYLANAPPFIEFLVNSVFKTVLKEKLFKRVKISSNDASAYYDIIPQDVLPSDIANGKDKSSAELNEYWLNQLVEHRSWFEHTSKQMSDESKRPPDESNTYGIDGTFRKLAVD